MRKLSLLLLTVCLATVVNAQLTGTKNIPGDYATLAAAITDLNTQGVGAGGVTLNVIAGNPQTAPAGGYVIGNTGSLVLTTTSAANPVIIQGNGNTITAGTGHTVGALTDAVFKLIGADYITITGCTMVENGANTVNTPAASNTMTEWGVALLYVTLTDGSQNNTIQNNNISLNRTYLNTFGIYSNTRHSSTSITTSAEVTAASGSNSFNKVYGNTISNVNYGIVFIGAGTTIAAIDNGNDIGGASLATGNTITNWGGGAALSGYLSLTGNNYCIFVNQQINDNISYNTITSAALAQSVTAGGILKNYSIASPTSGTITTTINNNTVTVTNNPTATTTGSVIGINNQGLTPLLSTATMSMNNNVVQNCVLGGATSTTNGLTGITNLSLPGTMNMNGNSVINNAITATTATSGTLNGMSNSGACGTLNMNNNIIRNHASTATSGQPQGITNSGAVVTAINITDNQFGNASGGFFSTSTATSGTLFGISTSGGAATCALTITGNDIRGITYNVAASAAQVYIQNSATTLSQNISSNTFTNLNVNTTGNVTFISNSVSAPAAGFKTINNNSIVTAFNKAGAGGTVALYTDGGSSTSTTAHQNNNNNFSNITVTGATTITGWFNNDGTGATPTKTITGNTFNNWVCGTSSVIVLQSNFGNPGTVSGNTVTNITGQGTVTGIQFGSSGTITALNLTNNTVTGLSSTGTGGAVTGISNAAPGTGNSISSNTINTLSSSSTTATVAGISTSASVSIFNNTINTLSCVGTTSGVTNGIMSTAGAAVNIYKNKIYDLQTTGAFTTTPGVNGIVNSGSTSTATVNVYNNLIGDLKAPAATSTDAIRGISVTATGTTSNYNIYFNTVYLTGAGGTNFGSSGIFHAASATSSTAALNLRNNIVVNNTTPNGTGLAVAYRRSSGLAGTLANYASTSNNNLLYAGTPGASNLIYSDGTSSAQTLALYKSGVFTAGTIAPRDAASVTENTTFLSTSGASANFLHIDPAIATQAESGAAPIALVTDDYDGNVRNLSTPDIGADEGTFTLADITGPAISYTVIPNTLCLTAPTLSATITDASTVNTTAGTKPRIWYRKGSNANTFPATNDNTTDGWKYVESPDGASPFSFPLDYSLLFGGVPVAGDVIHYFVVAQDLAGTPNVGINTGTFAAPPTSVALGAGAFPVTGNNTYNIQSAILTAVTVGTGGTYTTLSDVGGLFAAINSGGLSGNTVATVITNTVETGTVALLPMASCGGSYTLTIVPNAATTPTLAGTNATALIDLNGADNVIFDGSNNGTTSKDMTISNTNTSGATILFRNDATNNTVKNTILLGVSTSTTNGTITFSTSTGSLGNSNNTINNCDVRDGATVAANGIYSNGSTTAPNATNTITGNNIFNWTNSGVVLAGTTGNGNSWVVSNNNVYQTATRSTTLTAISLAAGNTHTVNGNKLYQTTGTIGAAYTGISISGGTNGHTVNGNSIGGTDANRTGTALTVTSSSSNLVGIALSVGTTTATNVNSNTISNISATTTSTSSSVFAVNVTGGNVNIGTGGGNTFGGGAAAYDTIRNNYDNGIITNSGTGFVDIQNNVIGNVAYYRAGGDRTAGIAITAGTATIRKNIIRDITSNSTSTGFSFLPVGIYITTATAGNLVDSNVVFNIRNTNTSATATTSAGIIVSGAVTASTVRKNKVYNILADGTGTGSSAARVFGLYISSGSTTYANNMVGVGSTVGGEIRVTGIEDLSTGTNNYYFNSVSVTGTTSAGTNNSYAFNRSSTATVDIKNNVFSNTRTGGTGFHVAIANTNAAATGWAATASNYNDLFSSTPATVGQWLGSAVGNNRDFNGWKAAQGAGTPGSGGDANSFSVTPGFVSAIDLHIPAATNSPLESGGTAVGGITTDIDNDNRPGPTGSVNGGATAPDMGADEFDGTPASPMVYVSSTTTQTNTSNVPTNTVNQQIIGIQVVTTGAISPLSATSFTINTNGTNNVADITNAKLWYTGTSATFATTTQVGSTVGAPSGSFNITGSQVLAEGTNYFWLTYDIPCTATLGNLVDAECNSITVGSAQTPTVQAPTGSRTIVLGTLSGTKTIGTGGDYPTLTAAVAALNSGGMSGNTTFSILNNLTEAGAVVINQWAECAPGGYTLTISPASGTTPTISASSATAVIVLNGADRVTIDGSNNGTNTRDLTISNTSTAANTAAVWVSSLGTATGATNNTIKNCNIKAGANGAAGNTFGIYVAGTSISTSGTGNDNDNLTIDNNSISKAYYGIYAQATSTGVNDNLLIRDNSIGSGTAADYVTFRGMLVTQANNATIARNTIFNMVTTEAIVLRAMEISTGVTNTSISRNKIYNIEYVGTGFRAGQGISVNTTAPANIIISNNVIYGLKGHGSGTMTNNSLGIAILGGGGYDVYFNSVNISDNRTSTSSTDLHACMYIAGSVTAVNMRDNVFSMTAAAGNAAGKTYGIYCLSANTAFTSINYNDFYAPGTSNRFAGFLTSDRTTLADIQAGFGQNVNSLVADPLFNSNINLVPQLGSPLSAAGENPNATGITVDYLGVTRAATPTIGAYDNAGDAASPVITYTALTGTCATGNRTLTATITDATGVPTVGATMPRIYYRKNAGTWYSSQGVLTSGSGTSGTWDFTIVAADMGGVANPDVISYYVIAQDLAGTPNVGSNPSTGLVATDVNTVTTPPTPANTYLIQGTLAAGTYTVGTAGTYPTLTAAVSAYNNSCLTGNVVFQLQDAAYASETFPIIINKNPDASATKTLTIRPASGVNASFSAAVNNNPLIAVLGNYVTIDGSNNGTTTRNLTITNTSTTGPSVVFIGSTGTTPVTDVTVKNSTIINGVNTNSAVVITDATTPGNPGYFNNITIQNNSIQKAYIGVYSNAVVAAGNGSGLNLNSNDLSTSGANAIRLVGLYVQGVDGATVTNNTIGNFDNTSDEDDKGIWFATGTINSTATRNRIFTLGYNGVNGYGAHGIFVSTGSATANVRVANNSIYGLTGDGWDYTSVPTDNPIGIVLSGTQAGVSVQFNSINLSGNTLNQTLAMSMGVYLGAGSTADVRNNIIVNNLGLVGATGYGAVGVYAATANTQFTSINYNNYVVNPTGTGNKYIGQIAAAGSTTLATWQTATAQDLNSLSVDPQYTSSTNLNLLATSPMIGAGTTIFGITNDLTNSTRNNPPSIGAYEDKVVFSAKVYLQGAYNAILGRHRDNTAQWVTATNADALSQPYSAAPFSYAGTETVPSGFFASTGATNDPMDWVLLELRDTTSPTTVIMKRAAIIHEDGMITDVDGVSPVSFKGINAGYCFVVVRHRNHLGVRSGFTQLVDGNAVTPVPYDFTTAQDQARQDNSIGTNAAMAQDGSVFLLWGGNVNQDAYVRATTQTLPPPTKPSDAAAILVLLGGNANATGGYTPGDVNLDGYTRATTQTLPPPAKPSDAAIILSTPLGGNGNATRQEHRVNN